MLSSLLGTAAFAQDPTAIVQLVHNSPDPAVQVVDIYDGDVKFGDSVAFRTASSFGDAPAGTVITLGFAPRGEEATTSDDIALTVDIGPLEEGKTYIVMANGLLTTSDPEQEFSIDVFEDARQTSNAQGNTDVLVFHGSPDAPAVDVDETSGTPSNLVDGLAYGSFTDGYLELPTADYQLTVSVNESGAEVATYQAPLATLGLEDQALLVVASGFVAPADASEPSFGLFAIPATGGEFVALPVVTSTQNAKAFSGEASLFPNPTTGELTVNLEMEAGSDASVSVRNLAGQEVSNGRLATGGSNEMVFDFSDLEAGFYLLSIEVEGKTMMRKFQVIK